MVRLTRKLKTRAPRWLGRLVSMLLVVGSAMAALAISTESKGHAATVTGFPAPLHPTGPLGAGLTALIVDVAVAEAVVLVVLAARWWHNGPRVRRSRRFAACGRTGEVNPNYRPAQYTRLDQWDLDVLTTLGGLSRADAIARILAIQGFDRQPTVVSELDRPALQAAGMRRVYRGIHGPDSEQVRQWAQQFRSGELFIGEEHHRHSGTNVTPSKIMAGGYAHRNRDRDPYYTMISGYLPSQLWWLGTPPRRGGPPQLGSHWNDDGIRAALLGRDAVARRGGGYLLLLNRTAMVVTAPVESESLDPSDQSSTSTRHASFGRRWVRLGLVAGFVRLFSRWGQNVAGAGSVLAATTGAVASGSGVSPVTLAVAVGRGDRRGSDHGPDHGPDDADPGGRPTRGSTDVTAPSGVATERGHGREWRGRIWRVARGWIGRAVMVVGVALASVSGAAVPGIGTGVGNAATAGATAPQVLSRPDLAAGATHRADPMLVTYQALPDPMVTVLTDVSWASNHGTLLATYFLVWVRARFMARRSTRFVARGRVREFAANYRPARYTSIAAWDAAVLAELGTLSEDEAMARILAIQGFDGEPTAAHLAPSARRRFGYRKFYRGIYGKDTAQAARWAEQFRTGPLFVGEEYRRIGGTNVTQIWLLAWLYSRVYGRGFGRPRGTVISGHLPWYLWRLRAPSLSGAPSQIGAHWNNPHIRAALLGRDAVSRSPMGYLVLLNRTAAVVRPAPPAVSGRRDRIATRVGRTSRPWGGTVGRLSVGDGVLGRAAAVLAATAIIWTAPDPLERAPATAPPHAPASVTAEHPSRHHRQPTPHPPPAAITAALGPRRIKSASARGRPPHTGPGAAEIDRLEDHIYRWLTGHGRSRIGLVELTTALELAQTRRGWPWSGHYG